MAATKAATTMLSAVTSTQTSSALSCSTDYGRTVYGQVVVVGTPSAGATIQVQESPDGTNYISPPSGLWTASTLSAGTYYFKIATSADAEAIKVTFTAQTGGTSSTATVYASQVTGI